MQKGGVRFAKHAGTWYKKQFDSLNQQLTQYLSKSEIQIKDIKKIKAIIGPHAGFTYSGPVAAWGYNYFSKFLKIQKEQKPSLNVFLLGPSHHLYFQGCATTALHQWQTPLGIVQKLDAQKKFKKLSKKQQQAQHSLQMHLPYIRKIFGEKILLIPVMVGDIDLKSAQQYGKIFAKYFDDQNSVFVVSSDFCHWGPHFDYQPTQQGMQIWQYIQKLDKTGMNLIQKNDINSFSQYLKKTGNTICGQNPIKVLMSTIKNSSFADKLKTSFVKYDQSQKVKNMNGSSVSYATSVTYLPQL